MPRRTKRYLLNGAWIFAARVANPTGAVYPVTFYRKPKRLDAPPREQLYVAQAGTPSTRAMQFAVLGDALVLARQQRFWNGAVDQLEQLLEEGT